MHRVETTVLELAGQDSAGLLADVTSLLTTNGCNVRSAAVSHAPPPPPPFPPSPVPLSTPTSALTLCNSLLSMSVCHVSFWTITILPDVPGTCPRHVKGPQWQHGVFRLCYPQL